MSKGMIIALGVVLVLVIILGIIMYAALAPPRQAPAYNTRPEPTANKDEYVTHTSVVEIDVTLDQYAQWSEHMELGDVLSGDSNLPAVEREEMLKGTWGEKGARRRIVLSDGHFAAEEVLASNQPKLFRYQVWGYTNYAKLATDYAIGEFVVEDRGEKVQLTWVYSFHKRPVTAFFLERFVRDTWAPFMDNAAQVMKREAEKSAQEV